MIVHVQQHAPTQVTPGHVVTCACACTVPQSRALCVSSLRSLSPTSPRGTSRTPNLTSKRSGVPTSVQRKGPSRARARRPATADTLLVARRNGETTCSERNKRRCVTVSTRVSGPARSRATPRDRGSGLRKRVSSLGPELSSGPRLGDRLGPEPLNPEPRRCVTSGPTHTCMDNKGPDKQVNTVVTFHTLQDSQRRRDRDGPDSRRALAFVPVVYPTRNR